MGHLLRDNMVKLIVVSATMFLINFHYLLRFEDPAAEHHWMDDEPFVVRRPARQQNEPLPQYRPLPQRHPDTRVLAGDYIYYKDLGVSWDSAPVVIASHKLVFFTIPKVGCTVWKQLFRRMMGKADWESQDERRGLPHNPTTNGLQYLYDFDTDRATEIMTSPEWTRAIMVRDPKERFLSAFLDKSVRNDHKHIMGKCCPDGSCVDGAQTIDGFLRLVQRCEDDHWRSQNGRVDHKFWGFIDDVLHVESAATDAEKLLRKVGAWDEFGTSGWGSNGDSAIFQRKDSGGSHTNYAQWQVWKWYTPDSEASVVQQFQADYDNPLFQFKTDNCLTCQSK